jgi:uncharacterized protein
MLASQKMHYPSLLGLALSFALSCNAFAQDCPPQQMPLEQAREHIEKTPAKNAGLLWRIEKSSRVSWLYGTMHLMHIDYAKPGMQIMMGMRTSDVLAVEVNTYEPQTAANTSVTKFNLSQTLLSRLKKAYTKDCINSEPEQMLLSPILESQASRHGLFWGYGPDARLMQIAKRTGKSIVQLENLDLQINALAPKSQAEFDAQISASLESVENGSLLTHLFTLAKAWQSNDLQTFVQNTEKMNAENPAFLKRLNDERNILMASKIDLLHNEGKRVFVAVGATHMTGASSLPKLMQDKGYTVTFVPLKN